MMYVVPLLLMALYSTIGKVYQRIACRTPRPAARWFHLVRDGANTMAKPAYCEHRSFRAISPTHLLS